MKWKNNLLSTGIPLEIDTSEILAKRNFFITTDFKYTKFTGSEFKDFSVDISAGGHLPLNDEETIHSEIDLLIECKYRRENKKWLFFKAPRPECDIGREHINTLRAIDHFSLHNFDVCSTCYLDDILQFAVKGAEIDFHNGEVNTQSIDNGIFQLQYALPELLFSYIDRTLFNFQEDIFPIYFTAILVTNASLHFVENDIRFTDIENSSKFEDFTEEVPYLGYTRSFSPDFSSHCSRIFKKLMDHVNYKRIPEIKELREKQFGKGTPNNDAHEFIRDLVAAKNYTQKNYFNNFVVCNVEKLNELISLIVSEIE